MAEFQKLQRSTRKRIVRCSLQMTACGGLLTAAALAVVAAPATLRAEENKPAEKKINYVDHVQPILRQKCFTCHNPDKKSSDLDLTSYTSVMTGGASGEVIAPGSAADSYLYMLVTHESEPFMPPESEKLPDDVLAVIRQWIDGGALETAGSKPILRDKPKIDLTLSAAPSGRPEGPPPMPAHLGLQPVAHTERSAAVTALATNPWSPLAAVGGQQQVLLYNTQTLELVGVLPFPAGVPESLKFSRSGKLLLAGGGRGAAEGRVVVWSVETGERVIEVGDELDTVLAADISADQSRIALGGPNRVVRIYSTADGELMHEIRKHTEWIYALAFSPDGVLLATADRNGGLFIWETYTGREYLSLRGHGGAITELSWRGDSNVLASCSEDGSIRLWEMENGNQVKSWGAHSGGVASVEFAHNGNLVSCGRDRIVKLWDQTGKELRAFSAFSDIALKVNCCDETNRIIAGDWTGAIRVWNAENGSELGQLSPNPPMLQDRLSQATQALQERQAEHAKLKATHEAALSELNKTSGQLEAAKKAEAVAQAQAKAAETAVDTAKQQIAKLTAERDAAAKMVEFLEPVVSLLKESAEKALQAAEKSPEDKELAQVAALITAQRDQKSASLEAAKKTVVEKNGELEKAKQQLASAEKQLADTKTALGAATKRVADLAPAAEAATGKEAAAKRALESAAQAVASAQAQVDRWQAEITFSKQLEELAAQQAKLDELELAAAQAQAEVDRLTSELDASRQAAEEAKKQSQAADSAVKQAEKTLADASATEAAVSKSVTTLEGLLPALKETLANGQEAAKKAPQDKDVAAAVEQLTSLVETKTAALESAGKDLAQKAEAVKQAKAGLAAAQKQAADAAEALATAEKEVADLDAALKPAEETLAQARQSADAAHEQAEQMKAQLVLPQRDEPTRTAAAN